jgi:hypothetical protein
MTVGHLGLGDAVFTVRGNSGLWSSIEPWVILVRRVVFVLVGFWFRSRFLEVEKGSRFARGCLSLIEQAFDGINLLLVGVSLLRGRLRRRLHGD